MLSVQCGGACTCSCQHSRWQFSCPRIGFHFRMTPPPRAPAPFMAGGKPRLPHPCLHSPAVLTLLKCSRFTCVNNQEVKWEGETVWCVHRYLVHFQGFMRDQIIASHTCFARHLWMLTVNLLDPEHRFFGFHSHSS